MDNKHDVIIDFILTELDKKPRFTGDSIHSLASVFGKETGEKQDMQLWNKICRICEGDNLIEKIGITNMHEITPKGIDILLKHGSYLNFIKYKNALIDRQKEIEDLNFKVNQLQEDNLKYQTKNRTQDERIRNLEEQTKFIELIKGYWWFILTCLGIGTYIGTLLDKWLP